MSEKDLIFTSTDLPPNSKSRYGGPPTARFAEEYVERFKICVDAFVNANEQGEITKETPAILAVPVMELATASVFFIECVNANIDFNYESVAPYFLKALRILRGMGMVSDDYGETLAPLKGAGIDSFTSKNAASIAAHYLSNVMGSVIKMATAEVAS